MISETKLDETSPTVKFSLQGYCKPYQFDCNRNGGVIVLYVREDYPHDIWKENSGMILSTSLLKLSYGRKSGFSVVLVTLIRIKYQTMLIY